MFGSRNGERIVRIRLKGINSYTANLADGTTKTYWYAWKGGPRLQGEPGTPEFIASYNEAAAQKVTAPKGQLLSLLQSYQASDDFRQLAQRTRDDYAGIIEHVVEPEYSDFPLAALKDRRTRGVFLEWRDKLALKSRRQADYAWTVLARVLSWSKDRGYIDNNPCERGGRIYRGSRAEEIWAADDEAAFLKSSPAICSCRYCSHCGPGSDKEIYCACPGLPMTELISGLSNPRRAAEWLSRLAHRSRLRWTRLQSAARLS
jgi:hypothetical protein